MIASSHEFPATDRNWLAALLSAAAINSAHVMCGLLIIALHETLTTQLKYDYETRRFVSTAAEEPA